MLCGGVRRNAAGDAYVFNVHLYVLRLAFAYPWSRARRVHRRSHAPLLRPLLSQKPASLAHYVAHLNTALARRAAAAGWDAADPLAEAVMDTAGPREINASFLDFSLPFALPFGDFSLPFFTAFP